MDLYSSRAHRLKQTDPLFGPRTSAGANRPPVWATHIGWSKQAPCLGRAHRLKQTGPLFGPRRPAGAKQAPCLGRADPLEQNRPPVWAAQTRWSKTDLCFGSRRPAGAKQTSVWAAQTRWSKTDLCLGRAHRLERTDPLFGLYKPRISLKQNRGEPRKARPDRTINYTAINTPDSASCSGWRPSRAWGWAGRSCRTCGRNPCRACRGG